MKILPYVTIFVFVAACSSKTKAEENLPKPQPEPIAAVETVQGVVAVHDNNGNPQIVIEVKKDTRSKISYEVTGPNKDAVAARKGQRISVSGIVKNLSPFHKLIDVASVE